MPAMQPKPQWLRASFKSLGSRVDRAANVLRGMVVAQLGPFKSQGRGQFDRESLVGIERLGNAKSGGLKSRFTHPDMSSDGLGKFLGRVRDLRMDSATDERTGKTVDAVRGDLHFDPTALDTPPEGGKPLGIYVMNLAESDPAALSSSIVVEPDRFIDDGKGGLVQLDEGDEGPAGVTPLWRPRVLHASDIVDTGDAVDGLLSAPIDIDRLPLSVLWKGAQLLDAVFLDQSREVIEARLAAYVARYLDRKFGEAPPAEPRPALDARRLRMDEMRLLVGKIREAG